MITSRRNRKFRKGQNGGKQYHFVPSDIALFLVGFFLALGAICVMDGSSSHQDQQDSTSTSEKQSSSRNNLLENCNASCSELLFSDEGTSTIYSSPLTSLGAVNNLLLLRENNINNGLLVNNNDMAKEHQSKYFPRPSRLPPLIEKLVGSIDGVDDVDKKKNVMIYQEKWTNHNDLISPGATDKDKITAAMAAAAVAAVRAGKREHFRMKTLNEEWDWALRWIAGWEMQDYDDMSLPSSYPNGIMRGNKELQSLSEISKNKDVLLLKACLEECVDRSSDEIQQNNIQLKSQVRRKKKMSKGADKWLGFDFFSTISILTHCNSIIVYAICALVLSGIKYGTRFITHRSLLHKSDKLYEWLSSMEKDEYDKWSNKVTIQQQSTKCLWKKGKSKKKLRRNEVIYDENNMSIKDLDVKPRNEYVSIARTEIDEDEEEDYIGTHIEFHNIEINKNNDQLHHRKPKNEVPTTSNHRDPNDEIISSDEDRTDSSVTSTKWTVVSKDPSKSSNASCTSNLDDSDHLGKTLHQKSHVPNKTTTTQVSNDKLKKPTDPNLKKRSSRFKKNSIRASQTLMVPKEFCVVESSQKPSASIPKGDTYQLDHQVKFHNTDPILQRVPTEEERQKAFNQLRLFQTTQIKKIMRKKTPLSESRNDLNLTQFPETKNDVAVKPQLNWSPFRSIGVVSFNSPHTNKTADDYEENNSSTDSEDCLSKTDLLLSKLLDEDDEEMNDVKDQENEPCLCFNGVAPIGSWNSSHIPSGSSPLSNPFETRETSVWSTAQIKNLNSHSNSWGNM